MKRSPAIANSPSDLYNVAEQGYSTKLKGIQENEVKSYSATLIIKKQYSKTSPPEA